MVLLWLSGAVIKLLRKLVVEIEFVVELFNNFNTIVCLGKYAIVVIQTHLQIMPGTLQETLQMSPHIPVCVFLAPDSSQGQSANYDTSERYHFQATEMHGS